MPLRQTSWRAESTGRASPGPVPTSFARGCHGFSPIGTAGASKNPRDRETALHVLPLLHPCVEGVELKRSEVMNTSYKQLTRSTSDRMIAGVCAGLGQYTNIDPTVIRLERGTVVLPDRPRCHRRLLDHGTHRPRGRRPPDAVVPGQSGRYARTTNKSKAEAAHVRRLCRLSAELAALPRHGDKHVFQRGLAGIDAGHRQTGFCQRLLQRTALQ